LIVVILWRWLSFDYFEERYPAMLYFAQIRALDEKTSRPIDFEVKWDHEMISPFTKGSGPAKIETNADKTVVVSLVGLPLEEGLNLRIPASGYSSKVITIPGLQSGFLDRPAHIEEVRLRPIRSGSPAENTKESE
jgi:hypothetical protein